MPLIVDMMIVKKFREMQNRRAIPIVKLEWRLKRQIRRISKSTCSAKLRQSMQQIEL